MAQISFRNSAETETFKYWPSCLVFCTGWRISVISFIIQQETEKYIKQKERDTESFDRIFVSFSKTNFET